MEAFLNVSLAFPTVVFSFVLAVMVVYWLIALLGLVEIELLDNLVLPDGDGLQLEGLAGLLMRLGLAGIPLTIILTVLVFFCWLISYYAAWLLAPLLDTGWMRYLLGAGIAAGAFLAAVPLTSLVLRPVRALLRKAAPPASKSLLGQVGVVRSPKVTAQQGYAWVEDGGAGLTLQVRSTTPEAQFQRGTRVILIEYVNDMNLYRVVGEDEFRG